MDHGWDKLRRQGGTFRHILCRRTFFFSDIIYDILRRCRAIILSNTQRITFSALNEGAIITFSERLWQEDHIPNTTFPPGIQQKQLSTQRKLSLFRVFPQIIGANNAIGRFVKKEAHSLKEEKDTDCLNYDIMPNYRIQKVLQLVKYRI